MDAVIKIIDKIGINMAIRIYSICKFYRQILWSQLGTRMLEIGKWWVVGLA